MQRHTLKTTKQTGKRVGRGGKRGKTSGRGMKGQKSRAGHRIRPHMRDTIKKLPKRRGFGVNRARTVNPNRVRPESVTLASLEKHFSAGDTVTPDVLLSKGVIRRQKGRVPRVKILGNGALSKKITVSNCTASERAHAGIEKAGGTIA